MIRYIVVVHYHYDETLPADSTGEDNQPVPTYESREEAEKHAKMETGPFCTGYVWAVKVDG